MNVGELVRVLEAIAPPDLAAPWDNVGLLVGSPAPRVRTLLLCIDLTEAVLAEAIARRAQMVMAYHPVIFKPVKRITESAAPVAWQAARRGIAVYSMHTALDAVPGGVNDALADVLGLVDRQPLEPIVRQGACKIVTFVLEAEVAAVRAAAFGAGAGRIGQYDECSFTVAGTGTFRGGAGSHPTVGRKGRRECVAELQLELIAPLAKAAAVVAAIRAAHSYEEPAIDVYPLQDYPKDCGMGRVGQLSRPMSAAALIERIKQKTGLKHLLVATAAGKKAPGGKSAPITTAACGAGSCGEMFRSALAAGATFFLTGEMRHHDALAAAAAGLTVACLGHSNSERLALPTLARRIATMARGVKVTLSKLDKDPLEVV